MMGFNAAPAKDEKIQSITLPNYGLLQNKLEDSFVKYLWSIVDIAKRNQTPNPYEGGNNNLKGLPLSYFKDLQDDKELVFNSFDQLKNSILIKNNWPLSRYHFDKFFNNSFF